MGISKAQAQRVTVICKCGCRKKFKAFPVYEGGVLRVPEFKRGHHPNSRRNQTGIKPPWNKGLRKGDHDSIARMGFQTGDAHWNYDPEKHPDWFSPAFDFRAFAEKFGSAPRSKGGNKVYTAFRRAVIQRDNATCRDCGMQADMTEESDLLHVHHVVYVKHDKTRVFDPSNVVTLCYHCHRKAHRSSK
mgnify:CR=1 FL=1